MDRTEYINAIKKELGFLPEEERNKAAEYFDSYFTGAENAEAVISCLGDARTAAKGYYKNVYETPEEKRFTLPSWAVAAIAVFVMPAAVGLACVLLCTAAALVSAALFILAALIIVSVLMWFEGMKIIISSLVSHIILADKLIQIGIGFFMFGIGLTLTWLVSVWYSKMFPRLLKIVVDKGGRLLKRGNRK